MYLVPAIFRRNSGDWFSKVLNSKTTAVWKKSAVKLIMEDKYRSYKKSIDELGMDSMDDRRQNLCLKFAQRCLKNEKAKKMFPLNEKIHGMETRNINKYKVQHANTDRLKNFAQIYMQNLLNEHEKTQS